MFSKQDEAVHGQHWASGAARVSEVGISREHRGEVQSMWTIVPVDAVTAPGDDRHGEAHPQPRICGQGPLKSAGCTQYTPSGRQHEVNEKRWLVHCQVSGDLQVPVDATVGSPVQATHDLRVRLLVR